MHFPMQDTRKIHVWTRLISPMSENYYSYAVVFVSRRDDGSPYAFNMTVKALGLNNPSGYIVDVSSLLSVVLSPIVKVLIFGHSI